MAILKESRECIKAKIDELTTQFRQVQGLILTEEDLRCQLYCKLQEIAYLAQIAESKDPNVYASRVHAEISWFDENGLLTIWPDITIIEPKDLSILHAVQDGLRLPSKGFHAVGDAIIFELKFIRDPNGITEGTFQREIQSDYEKINRLFRKLEQDQAEHWFYCYMVIFSKVNARCESFQRFICERENDTNLEVICSSSGVVFRPDASGMHV